MKEQLTIDIKSNLDKEKIEQFLKKEKLIYEWNNPKEK